MKTNLKTATETALLEQDQTRQRVRARYGEIARRAGRGCGCGPVNRTPRAASEERDSVLDGGGPLPLSPAPASEAKAPESWRSPQPGGTDPLALGYSAAELEFMPDDAEMGLGCGNPTALAAIQPGQTVLDLGSGGGFDCFLAAQRTGPTGRVIGVDMTPEMISKARAHAARGGHTNVEFRLGEIENLPVADASVDLILSNCVINLSPDKPRVFAEAFRALKPGGRLAVSDIVALQPIPEALKADFAAYTGCVAGAASPAAVEKMLRDAGFAEARVAVKESSRAFINDWLPGARAGDYVASADITARKPETACCAEGGSDRDAAAVWVAGESGERIAFNGAEVTVRLGAAHTGDQFSLCELVAPRGRPTPLHADPVTEVFHVLEGELLFDLRGERRAAWAGDTVLVPAGLPHAFVVASEQARFLVWHTPRAQDGFFRDTGHQPGESLTEEERGARMQAALARHGITVFGPPPFALGDTQPLAG